MHNVKVKVGPAVVEEFKKIIRDSAILKEDDHRWPEPDVVGKQELEVKMDSEHIAFTCSKLGALSDCMASDDPEGEWN